jgi:catechol 2,3-dioxygenase-like lactoylglutathione lyase family enzyme
MLSQQKLTAFVAITDYDQSRAFYEGILGLKFLSQDNFAMVMESSGTKIRMAKLPNLQPAQFTVLGWEVSNIEKIVGDLQSRGVQFDRYPFMPRTARPSGPPPAATK